MANGARTFARSLTRYYGFYTGGFISFIVLLAIAEQMGMSNVWIGYVFMAATIGLYAGIGIMSRTADITEYYVAGRRVPAVFNGMATGADWMSAASFIGMAGTLYLAGYDGLAFVMGWTGGYVLVALFLAPYLRKFGQFTIPDFLGARYGGNLARTVGVFAAVLASFTYVVAQIYGVGLITSRFLGLDFVTGVFTGLAGILVCSFLGGMRAVTWTQVAQYIILIIAYLVPVLMLSQRITEVPVPQLMYGQVLQKVTEREQVIFQDPRQLKARAQFQQRASEIEARIKALPASLDAERQRAEHRLTELKAAPGSDPQAIEKAEKELKEFPRTPAEAKEKWGKELERAKAGAKAPTPHAQPFPGEDDKARNTARLNFLALALCLMVGTAALPHILTRYYTTPSVKEARESVFWSLVFIFLLYFTAPSLAVLAKFEVYTKLIGSSIVDLPSWVAAWGKVGLVKIEDINQDGILQLAELTLNPDVIVLATPEIAGLPYVVSGLVAAGGLAAALSTADGLLLTIANALSHDVYYKMIDHTASTRRRVTISKALLLVVAVIAAYVASLKPDHILFMVAWAFSIAASAFFPALTLGIFWKRANRWGAVAGMVVGLGICLYYLVNVKFYGMTPWFGIKDIAAGAFGVPAGFLTIITVSLLTPAPEREIQELVERCRYPRLKSDTSTEA
jgi:cation/acetate symporter